MPLLHLHGLNEDLLLSNHALVWHARSSVAPAATELWCTVCEAAACIMHKTLHLAQAAAYAVLLLLKY
jgi:hypothetical protein